MSNLIQPVQAYLSKNPTLSLALTILGGLSVASFAFKTLAIFAETFVLPGTSWKKYGAGKGAWAVVTGASDGIGKEFATQLANKGFNVMIVARNQAKLDAVKDEIRQKHGDKIQVKIHLIDFSTRDNTKYDAFAKACEGLDIGVLINNVGIGHFMPVEFVDMDLEEMDSILTVNINANLRVAKIILPALIKKRRGLILNVGSFSGSTPCAMLSTYSASKYFISSWSDSLAQEVKPHGVDVQLLNTYFVVSKLSKIRRPSLFIPTSRAYVRSVMSKIGLACGSKYTGRPSSLTPYWSHALMDWVINTLVKNKSIEMRYNLHIQKDIRRRALKRLEKERKGI